MFGFWQGGPRTHLIALKNEFSKERRELAAKLMNAQDEDERMIILNEINDLTIEYENNIKAIRYNLY